MKRLWALILALVINFAAFEAKALPIYESQKQIGFTYRVIKKGDSFYKLFKGRWKIVARFNRMDEKHLIVGMRIKVPNNLENLIGYAPMPESLERAKGERRYILVDLKEQFLGLYEYGVLKFSAPISSAHPACCYTPSGRFQVRALHRDHVSSIYKDATSGENIPMPFASLFYIESTPNGKTSYWIHGGDLPGYPDSHGCVRVSVEDAKRVYEWLGGNLDGDEIVWIRNGVPVEIVD